MGHGCGCGWLGCHERNAWLRPQRRASMPGAPPSTEPGAVRLAVNNNSILTSLCILTERLILVLLFVSLAPLPPTFLFFFLRPAFIFTLSLVPCVCA